MESLILKGLVTNDGIDRLRNGTQRRRSVPWQEGTIRYLPYPISAQSIALR